MRDLTVGFIFGEEWDSHFALSLFHLLSTHQLRVLPQPSGRDIDKGRNDLVTKFLATDSEWLLMVDTDMTFTPADVERIYAHADENLIISGMCAAADGTIAARKRNPETHMWHVIESTTDCVEVDYAGAAFMLAHRNAYEKIQAEDFSTVRPWFAFSEDSGILGEDAMFCLRAKQLGFRVVVDGQIRPGHRKMGTVVVK